MTDTCLACGGPLQTEATIKQGRDLNHSVPGEFDIHVCKTCGSGTTLPLASDDQLAEFYPKEYEAYEETSGVRGKLLLFLHRMRMKTGSYKEISILTPGRALDIGCGRGDLGAYLIRHGWQVSGVEIDPEAARMARARGMYIHEGTLRGFSSREKFDLIVWSHSLEHSTDPQGELQEAWQMLRKGGTMLIALPHWNSWQRKLFRSRWFALELPRHRTHFTSGGLRLALYNAGAEQVRTLQTTSVPVFIWSLQYVLFQKAASAGALSFLWGGLGMLLWPLLKIVSLFGGGDTLHAIAKK